MGEWPIQTQFVLRTDPNHNRTLPKFWSFSCPYSDPTLFGHSWFLGWEKWRMVMAVKHWPFTLKLTIRLFWLFFGLVRTENDLWRRYFSFISLTKPKLKELQEFDEVTIKKSILTRGNPSLTPATWNMTFQIRKDDLLLEMNKDAKIKNDSEISKKSSEIVV